MRVRQRGMPGAIVDTQQCGISLSPYRISSGRQFLCTNVEIKRYIRYQYPRLRVCDMWADAHYAPDHQCRSQGKPNLLHDKPPLSQLLRDLSSARLVFQLVMAIWREGFQTEVVTGTSGRRATDERRGSNIARCFPAYPNPVRP